MLPGKQNKSGSSLEEVTLSRIHRHYSNINRINSGIMSGFVWFAVVALSALFVFPHRWSNTAGNALMHIGIFVISSAILGQLCLQACFSRAMKRYSAKVSTAETKEVLPILLLELQHASPETYSVKVDKIACLMQMVDRLDSDLLNQERQTQMLSLLDSHCWKQHGNKGGEPDKLTSGLLFALSQVGTHQTSKILKRWVMRLPTRFKHENTRILADRANKTVLCIEERLHSEHAPGVLLRSSCPATPPDTLLRPVSGTEQPVSETGDQLLRSTATKASPTANVDASLLPILDLTTPQEPAQHVKLDRK